MSISTPISVTYIYRLLVPEDWVIFQNKGVFEGHEHDKRDGFIHFSSAAQLSETAAKHYARHRTLILAEISTEGLGAALKWEISRAGELFPHLYAPLFLESVVQFWDLKADLQGVYDFSNYVGLEGIERRMQEGADE